MTLKVKDRNDFLLLGALDEASCFIEIESWQFAVQFGWELYKSYQRWTLFFWLLALNKYNFTTETLLQW